MEALQISIPVWNITELNGYEPITTFWQDFSIADKFGIAAIEDTYRRVKSEWKTTANIGQSCALYSIIRFGNGMRLIDRRPFYMISFGVKLTK